MKRAEASLQFTLDSGGYITTPGPFYGERFFIPHYWGKACSTMRRVVHKDGQGHSWQLFTVTEADRKEYPELEAIERVSVRKDEEGNILSWVMAFGHKSELMR